MLEVCERKLDLTQNGNDGITHGFLCASRIVASLTRSAFRGLKHIDWFTPFVEEAWKTLGVMLLKTTVHCHLRKSGCCRWLAALSLASPLVHCKLFVIHPWRMKSILVPRLPVLSHFYRYCFMWALCHTLLISFISVLIKRLDVHFWHKSAC